MCLGVPGQVIEWLDHDPVFGRAMIEFDGIRRECQMACVPDAKIGQYVIVHAGIAISRIDSAQARHLIDELNRLETEDDFAPVFGHPEETPSTEERPQSESPP